MEHAVKTSKATATGSFVVATEYLGMLIGKGGSNLKSVKSQAGYSDLVIDDKSVEGQATVTIYAETDEQVAEARKLLEIVMESVPVPTSVTMMAYHCADLLSRRTLEYWSTDRFRRLSEMQNKSGCKKFILKRSGPHIEIVGSPVW